MINIITEPIKYDVLSDGLYVDPHYIPYLDEYLKYIRYENKGKNPHNSLEAYNYVKSIQIGVVPSMCNNSSVPHIREWLPDWFRPSESPLAMQSVRIKNSLQRDFIYEDDCVEILEVLKEYPKISTVYQSIALHQRSVGIMEMFESHYVVTSDMLIPYPIKGLYTTTYGEPTGDEIIIKDKTCDIWKFRLNI